ncbi:MAG: isoprenyl transferase [Acidobacteriota bacterium]|jgi:undecaprenyl diphosphate synthase|nr:isoprenyl transferase [Acidobacteriota bacterium]
MELAGFVKPGSEEATLLAVLDARCLPRHVAVIMDGNGRWANQRLLPRVMGHRSGIDSVREIVEDTRKLGIGALTLYAFSTENWKRPKTEVRTLMRLLKEFIRKEMRRVHENNIKFRAIGRIQELDESVREELRRFEELTCGNTGMVLNVALNYSGRAELTDACRRIIEEYIEKEHAEHAESASDGNPPAAAPVAPVVNEETISNFLYTAGLPDPDLLIRTSGEMRISNFMLWQIAYSEIYITPTLWPDFRRRHLLEALVEYQRRDRRYGGI